MQTVVIILILYLGVLFYVLICVYFICTLPLQLLTVYDLIAQQDSQQDNGQGSRLMYLAAHPNSQPIIMAMGSHNGSLFGSYTP